jgi:hypothetical protein
MQMFSALDKMLEELEKRKAAMERCTRSGCYTFFLDVSGGGKTTTSECSLLLLRVEKGWEDRHTLPILAGAMCSSS